MPGKHIPDHLQVWIDARKKFQLSHAQVQMARELGFNPRKLGKLANHKQEPWKMPLPEFIEDLYRRRYGADSPAAVMSIEEKVEKDHLKKLAKRATKQAANTYPGETREELNPNNPKVNP
jgi:hypothetical protein